MSGNDSASKAVELRLKKLPHCQALPKYATKGSSGLDLTAAIESEVVLNPGQRCKIPTGIIIEIPDGYEGQLRARSGLASRAGITLTNSVGTIDSDFRGEVCVLLINLGQEQYVLAPGERVAQLVIVPVPKVHILEVEELSLSQERGSGGFGSTGRAAIK